MIYFGKMQSHTWIGMHFKACLHAKSWPYSCTELVKLSGYVPCAAIPLWNKNDFFTLESSHTYSRKSIPKGSYAGVTGCSCAVHWTGWGGYVAALPPACVVHQQDAAAPCKPPYGGLCVLSYTGRSLFRKPLKPSRRESQEGRNAKGPANAIGGSSDMILQCKIAAKLCWGVQRNRSRRKGGGLVLLVVFPLCNPLTWLSQQGGTELCSLSEILSATEGHLKRSSGKHWLTRRDQRS